MKKIIKVLNENSGAIESIMVIVLALITSISVWDTRRLTKISTKQLELYTQPSAVVGESIEVIVRETSPGSHIPASTTDFVKFVYSIKNIGNVPVKYSVHTSFEDHVGKPSNEPILYPGQILKHTTEAYDIETISPRSLTGVASIKIIYWALEFPKKKFFFSRRFALNENVEGYSILEDNAGKEE